MKAETLLPSGEILRISRQMLETFLEELGQCEDSCLIIWGGQWEQ